MAYNFERGSEVDTADSRNNALEQERQGQVTLDSMHARQETRRLVQHQAEEPKNAQDTIISTSRQSTVI